MECVLIHQSLSVRINRSDELSMWRINHSEELSVWRIKPSQLYFHLQYFFSWWI